MTVPYRSSVSTINFLGLNFLRLLFRWKGSIYKLIWPDLLFYTCLYITFQWTYTLVLTPSQRKIFEDISRYCSKNERVIPLQFVLGFFVSMVVDRWWGFVRLLPSPDNLALSITSLVEGLDEDGRAMRRTMIRYVNLAYILAMKKISPPVNSRFPTYDHLVDAGIMNNDERDIFYRLDKMNPHSKYIVPIVWTGMLFESARDEGRVNGELCLQSLWEQLQKYRHSIHSIVINDWISIPLVYTQLATLAIYAYFVSSLFSKQFLKPENKTIVIEPEYGPESNRNVDLYFPFFLFVEFFFYVGWLKVTEFMFNPFGDDDDDFDINWMIDRHLEVSYLYVDDLHFHYPHLLPCNLVPLTVEGENRDKEEKKGKIILYSTFLKNLMKEKEKHSDSENEPDRHEEKVKPEDVQTLYEAHQTSPLPPSAAEGGPSAGDGKNTQETKSSLRRRQLGETYLVPDTDNEYIPYTKASAPFNKRQITIGSVPTGDISSVDDYFVSSSSSTENDDDYNIYNAPKTQATEPAIKPKKDKRKRKKFVQTSQDTAREIQIQIPEIQEIPVIAGEKVLSEAKIKELELKFENELKDKDNDQKTTKEKESEKKIPQDQQKLEKKDGKKEKRAKK